MLATIEGLLAGELTREQGLAWCEQLRPPKHDGRSPFYGSGLGDASAVFESLWNLDQLRADGEPWVRELDLRGYRRWLREGHVFVGTRDPMVGLRFELEALVERVGGEPVRFWNHGLGWYLELRFCAPLSGRPFVAFESMFYPGGCSVHFRRGDDPQEALRDLFETLAMDEHELGLHPELDAERLPQWALWREDDNNNRFEIERSRSYAKLAEREQMFEARGHRQSYWIEPV